MLESWRTGESIEREFCVVESEVWKVITNLRWKAFGTPIFSQRPDAGYGNAWQDVKRV
jgi:biotin operon repressor